MSGLVVGVAPEGDRELADALDQLVGLDAFLLADDVAEDAAQQPDVLDQGAFVVSGAAGRAMWAVGAGLTGMGLLIFSAARMLASIPPKHYKQVTRLSKLVIATRESRLALWQAEHVKALLEQRGHEVSLLGMTTKGDQILDRQPEQGRRQGPVRQGARGRAGGGPRRPRGAFAQGRADGPAARASRWPA